ncbi:uncharacterized protein LOC110970686 isoform X1 [Acanthochromis polyacanthus]|uniref:uncharacterized protein LOC110970686 isoform X1 n=1 Tax=Acanthochromis polyacanthus TaxID=80966 RepID=UPI002234D031|nr:uncharacterized protein LOC110970686 isoform X1 [Acanthochromis polyacanthus]
MQLRGQASLFGGTQTCSCGFHAKKPSSSVPGPPQPGPSAASSTETEQPQTSGRAATSGQTPRKPSLTLASFMKPRFGGSHGAALTPNLSLAGKHVSTVSSSSPSLTMPSAVTSAMASRPQSPARSPRTFIQAVSPLSPVATSTSAASVPPATARAETSASSSAPLIPLSSVPTSVTSIGVPSTAPSQTGPSELATPHPLHTQTAGDVETPTGSEQCWLPAEMKKNIPVQDQKWISAAIWKNQRLRTDLKLWYAPPEPALIYHQAPTPERFFTHRLLLWMPYHLWKVKLYCPACGKQLTGAGVHKRARKVLDIDRYYLLITETQFSWLQDKLHLLQQDYPRPTGYGSQAGVQTHPDSEQICM